jgi:hypothetical protein
MGTKNEVKLGRIIGKVIQTVILVGTAILAPKAKKKWYERKKS